MKRILLTIICFVAVIFAYAEGHMTFKGIEIDGDIESFVAKLEAQGFDLTYQADNAALMSGKFTAEEVSLFIYSTPISKLVYTVLVKYQPTSQWYVLERKYNSLVESLKKKYGEPSASVWEVNNSGDPEHELKMGRATIMTGFETEKGYIIVNMVNGTDEYGFTALTLHLMYRDKENNALSEQEAESDL